MALNALQYEYWKSHEFCVVVTKSGHLMARHTCRHSVNTLPFAHASSVHVPQNVKGLILPWIVILFSLSILRYQIYKMWRTTYGNIQEGYIMTARLEVTSIQHPEMAPWGCKALWSAEESTSENAYIECTIIRYEKEGNMMLYQRRLSQILTWHKHGSNYWFTLYKINVWTKLVSHYT